VSVNDLPLDELRAHREGGGGYHWRRQTDWLGGILAG
jgi:hypothetical protein